VDFAERTKNRLAGFFVRIEEDFRHGRIKQSEITGQIHLIIAFLNIIQDGVVSFLAFSNRIVRRLEFGKKVRAGDRPGNLRPDPLGQAEILLGVCI
jgi:hypothetical protein